MNMDEDNPIDNMEGFNVGFANPEASSGKLPPGTYTCKIVEDLNTHWRMEIAKGAYKGIQVILPKMTIPHMRNHRGVPQSHFGEGNLN